MISFTTLALAISAASGALAHPSLDPRQQGLTESQTGESNGYYFSFWTDGSSDVVYTNLDGGSYSAEWSNNQGNWVGGKGWNPGTSDR